MRSPVTRRATCRPNAHGNHGPCFERILAAGSLNAHASAWSTVGSRKHGATPPGSLRSHAIDVVDALAPNRRETGRSAASVIASRGNAAAWRECRVVHTCDRSRPFRAILARGPTQAPVVDLSSRPWLGGVASRGVDPIQIDGNRVRRLDRHLWEGAYGPSTGSQAGRRHDRAEPVIVTQGRSMLPIDGVRPKSSGPGRRRQWWKHRCVSEASATDRLTAVPASLATMVAWSG